MNQVHTWSPGGVNTALSAPSEAGVARAPGGTKSTPSGAGFGAALAEAAHERSAQSERHAPTDAPKSEALQEDTANVQDVAASVVEGQGVADPDAPSAEEATLVIALKELTAQTDASVDVVDAASLQIPAVALANAGIEQPTHLQAWALGPNIRVISNAQHQISEEVLADYAQEQGVEWSAIQGMASQATVGTSLGSVQGGGASADIVALSSDASPLDIMTRLVRAGLGQSLESKSLAGSTAASPTWPGMDAVDAGTPKPSAFTLEQTLAQMTKQGQADLETALQAPAWKQSLDLLKLAPASAGLVTSSAAATDATGLDDFVVEGGGGANGEDAQLLGTHQRSSTPAMVSTKDVLQQDALLLGRQQSAMEDVAQKMGEALAQRIQAQIQRGHWRMSLSLNPRDLGHIDVTLGMKGQDLQASFQAAHGLTRDLIQESLPRLRETLANAGIDVASFDVGGHTQRESGGNPTAPGQNLANAGSGAVEEDATRVMQVNRAKIDSDGLDIWA